MKRKLLVRCAIGFPLGVVICFVIAGIIGTLGAADGTIHLCSPLLIKAVGGLAPSDNGKIPAAKERNAFAAYPATGCGASPVCGLDSG